MNIYKFVFVSLTFLFLFYSLPLSAAEIKHTGKVVGISDGDTIAFLDGKNQIKVRLAEIDAPEKDQPYGMKSKEMLSSLIFGRSVNVFEQGVDRYGRVLGRIFIDDTDINLEMVKLGGAWAYKQYLTDHKFLDAENNARSKSMGLWNLQSDQIMPPWEWRKKARADAGKENQLEEPMAGKPSTSEFVCNGKRYCKQMKSCSEAKFYLSKCQIYTLDGDKDGIPCEAICQ